MELGPGQTFTRLALQSPARPPRPLTVSTLPGSLESRPDLVVFLAGLARLWTAGVDVDLTALAASLDG